MKGHTGIDVKIDKTVKIIITLSKDRADCILHQLDEIVGGEIDDAEFPDLSDFINTLNEGLGES